MKKNILFIVFIILFVIILIVFNNNEVKKTDLRTQAIESARRGWQWLYNYQEKFSDPVIPFIIKKINEDYCGSSAKIENFGQDIFKEFNGHPYLPIFERLLNNDPEYKISDKVLGILKTPQEYYNDVLPQALYCDLYPVRDDFAEKTFDGIEKETGYDLTHKFWSAILFKSNECAIKNYNIDNIISIAAQKIYEEQEKSNFDDLYAERTAFLMNYGFKNMVPEDWIKNIIASQNELGAWGTPTYFSKNFENPHTTALAIWSLVQYSQICPF